MATQSTQIHQSPSDYYAAVTPHDSTNLTDGITRYLYIGGAGNLVAVRKDGTTVTFNGVLAGTVLPIRVIRVNATSTTATNIVAIY